MSGQQGKKHAFWQKCGDQDSEAEQGINQPDIMNTAQPGTVSKKNGSTRALFQKTQLDVKGLLVFSQC